MDEPRGIYFHSDWGFWGKEGRVKAQGACSSAPGRDRSWDRNAVSYTSPAHAPCGPVFGSHVVRGIWTIIHKDIRPQAVRHRPRWWRNFTSVRWVQLWIEDCSALGWMTYKHIWDSSWGLLGLHEEWVKAKVKNSEPGNACVQSSLWWLTND